MEEPLAELFTTVGISLEFDFGTILGIPETALLIIQGNSGPYNIKSLDHTFLLRSADVSENEITEGTTFSIVDTGKLYSFSVMSTPLNDLTGITMVAAALQEVSDV